MSFLSPYTGAEHSAAIAWVQAVAGANNNLLLNGAVAPAGLTGGLAWLNGAAPSANVTNGISLWVDDRVAGEAGLRLRSESGALFHFGDRTGIGTLSPASFFHVVGAAQIGGNLLLNTATVPTSLASGLVWITGTAATGTVAAGSAAMWFDGTTFRCRIGSTTGTFLSDAATVSMVAALRAGTGNARLHPSTYNLQTKISGNWYDIGGEDQGGFFLPVVNQTADND